MKKHVGFMMMMQLLLAGVPQAAGQSGEDFNMLANAERFRPTVVFSDVYGQRLITYPAEVLPGEPREPAAHDVIDKPGRISARVVASLQAPGFDLSQAISDEMAVGLTVGDFSFEADLASSREAERNGGTFPPDKKRATFPFLAEYENANGDFVVRSVGSITFSWNAKTLTVTLACADIEGASISGIAADQFIGLYEDLSDEGNRPAGRAAFSNVPVPVSVTFGELRGDREAYARGVSATGYRRFGPAAEPFEEFTLEAVTVQGSADTAAPRVAAAVPPRDTNGDGLVSFTLTATDLAPQVIAGESEALPAPIVEISNGVDEPVELVPDGETSARGVTTYSIADLPLTGSQTWLEIAVTDDSGNRSVVKKRVTSAASFPTP
jgi:hypothetical protein